MLFHVRMDVHFPLDMPSEITSEIKAREDAYSQQLQRSGKWRHIWRLAGEYANFSIFDVESKRRTARHSHCVAVVPVQALCRHRSSVRKDGA